MSRRSDGGLDGLMLLDKPLGCSSNHALQQLRRLFARAKAGHGGTLDPLATGMLPVALGEATKFLHGLLEADKTYEAGMMLGRSSSTGDAEGELSAWSDPTPHLHRLVSIVERFKGPQQQIPPMYAALKHQGKALYAWAREGVDVPREPRAIVIHQLDILDMVQCASSVGEMTCLRLRVHCSKGTYIRSLAQDIGAALGCGAFLSDLRRVAVGRFEAEDMIALETLEPLSLGERCLRLLPTDSLLLHLERIDLDRDAAQRLLQGQRLPQTAYGRRANLGTVRLYRCDGQLLGTGTVDDRGLLTAQRLIAQTSISQ
ncbi:MAG: tRNA pseudouridine(55) synthase TruB [Betaproteobacteria bacterium]|nr:tRNA pseudouridine(55) synthase TruB [Betaproteobacteria bacterium]